jgi:sulfur carrier protein
MKFTINGEERKLPDVGTIAELLAELSIDTQRGGIAVAHNDHVVPRARWRDATVAEGDRLEIIHAVQGG